MRSSAVSIRPFADDTEAIRLDPLTPEFFDNRGLAYADNGDYDRAIADYNEAIRLRPEAKFLDNRGNSYNYKGDYDRAIADYDRAIATGSVPARSRDRCRLQGRARQPQRQSRRATAAGSARLPCRAQQVLRQSAIQSASRNGIAARSAARHERTHELSLAIHRFHAPLVPASGGCSQYFAAIGNCSAGNNEMMVWPLSVTTTSSSMRAAE